MLTLYYWCPLQSRWYEQDLPAGTSIEAAIAFAIQVQRTRKGAPVTLIEEVTGRQIWP